MFERDIVRRSYQSQLESALPICLEGDGQDIRCTSGDDLRHPHHVSSAIAICIRLVNRQQRLVVCLPQERFIEPHTIPADKDSSALAPLMHLSVHLSHHFKMRHRAGGDVSDSLTSY